MFAQDSTRGGRGPAAGARLLRQEAAAAAPAPHGPVQAVSGCPGLSRAAQPRHSEAAWSPVFPSTSSPPQQDASSGTAAADLEARLDPGAAEYEGAQSKQ